MTGQAGSRAGGDEPRGRRGGHASSRRSSLSAAPDRSLRSCGGPPTTPTVDAVIGDVPAVRVADRAVHARRAEKDEDERLDRYVVDLAHRERSRPRSWTTCYVVAT